MAFLWRDVRYAVRGLAKNPGFTALSVVALGLGIGASTAIFSVVDNILLNPFPYLDADRLAVISIVDKARADGLGRSAFIGPEYLAIASRNSVFEDIAGDAGKEVLYRMGDGTELFTGGACTPNTFQFFGISAYLGRTLIPADYQPGAPPVFVMRYKTWVARFNADPGALGKTYVLNGTARTLVGIMAPRFAWGNHDIWMPADLKPTEAYFAVARLKRGVSLQRAQADMTVIARQLAQQFPRYYPKQYTVKVQSLADSVVGRFQSSLALVVGAVGLLLLIGCANVANLMLARSTARAREFAIRTAMGAGRWRLVRQFVVESLTLAALGAAFGCLLAWAGLRGLVAAIPPKIIPAEAEIRLNGTALLFALGVAAVTALIFGLIPALHASRQDVNETLRSGGRGVGGGFRRARLRGALVVCEVALSLVLLAGAGLLMRSFLAISHQELGLRADHVLTARIPLPADRYKTVEQMTYFYRTLVERLKAEPGVLDASEALNPPLYGGFNFDVEVAGKTHSERGAVSGELAGDGYFATMRIPIVSGRAFSASEVYDARKLAVVNQTFARKYLGPEPIGQRVHIGALETIPQPVKDAWFDVIGVAGDAKNQGPLEPVKPAIWVPFTVTSTGARNIVVRTANDPHAMLNTLRREVWGVDRGVALTNAASLEDTMNETTYAQPRFTFLLLAVFAAAGLALTMVGVYGVMSYATARQTQEIGIRMALGASRGAVLRMVIGSGLKLVGAGIAIGLAASLLLGRVVASQLWGVSPYDPATLIAVPILLALTSALACWIPARRATLVDPAVCLRYE